MRKAGSRREALYDDASRGCLQGLKGKGTFTVVYMSKTDAISQWSGDFTSPSAMLSAMK